MKPGISFKSLSSRSLGLTMRTISWPLIPSMTRSSINVPKRAGSVDFGMDTMLESQASFIFSWLGATPQEVQQKGEIISGWLNNDGKYYEFTNNAIPDRKYYAKVTDAVPLAIDPCGGSVRVTFTFNPPYAFRLDNSPVSPQDAQERLLWDTARLTGNQYIQTFNTSGLMRFTLTGEIPVKPVIKLFGYIPSGTELIYGSFNWKCNVLIPFDGVKIDCLEETVTRISDGTNIAGSVSPDDFFEFTPGQIEINLSSSLSAFPKNLTMAVELTPGY